MTKHRHNNREQKRLYIYRYPFLHHNPRIPYCLCCLGRIETDFQRKGTHTAHNQIYDNLLALGKIEGKIIVDILPDNELSEGLLAENITRNVQTSPDICYSRGVGLGVALDAGVDLPIAGEIGEDKAVLNSVVDTVSCVINCTIGGVVCERHLFSSLKPRRIKTCNEEVVRVVPGNLDCIGHKGGQYAAAARAALKRSAVWVTRGGNRLCLSNVGGHLRLFPDRHEVGVTEQRTAGIKASISFLQLDRKNAVENSSCTGRTRWSRHLRQINPLSGSGRIAGGIFGNDERLVAGEIAQVRVLYSIEAILPHHRHSGFNTVHIASGGGPEAPVVQRDINVVARIFVPEEYTEVHRGGKPVHMLKIQAGASAELSPSKVTAAVTRIGGGTHRFRHGETVLKVYSQLQPSLII